MFENYEIKKTINICYYNTKFYFMAKYNNSNIY